MFNRGLINGINIIKSENYRNFRLQSKDVTEFIVVGMVGTGINRNYGQYDHHYTRYPIVIEVHSVRSDDACESWVNEVFDLIQGRRKNISNLYSDYRKIIMETEPTDKGTNTKFKWIFTFYLETHVQGYPAQTYDGGGALDGMPAEILDGGSA